MSDLSSTPISALHGIGTKMAERLDKMAIHTVQDLLFHLPARYEDRTKITPIAQTHHEQTTAIQGCIVNQQTTFGGKSSLLLTIRDQSGEAQIRFFHFTAAMKNRLKLGQHLHLYGEIKRTQWGIDMLHPDFTFVQPNQAPETPCLTPIYPSTEGLKQPWWQKITEQALTLLTENPLIEALPQGFYPSQLPINTAISLLHRPPADCDQYALKTFTHPAQQRLIFEELLAQNLAMLKLRQQTQQQQARAIPASQTLKTAFLASLPFSPTSAQSRVTAEIEQDLQQAHPMLRLVQGDVGSGKTLVAALAALSVIEQGGQVALMAPTEILAEQHAATFQAWLSPLGVTVGWLSGKTKAKHRRETLQQLAENQQSLIVGTHALFQEDVKFASLQLVIIDEQHRFGVAQRTALKEKGQTQDIAPHQLVMTATPIPRTLAMTAYADLQTSIIDELPKGRQPITTVTISHERRDDIIQRINLVCQQDNRQAYWVCSLIDESDALEAQAATDTHEYLQQQLPKLRIGLVHGRMKSDEKQRIMQAFKAHELDLLVATTVIEVGVDVPNASLMIIENPERLGLAQLHQLRGRVGRGKVASHCVLLYKTPLTDVAKERLTVMRDSQDGFVIAQKDLTLRGPGDVLGTQQTGALNFKVADLLRDQAWIERIPQDALNLQQYDPNSVDILLKRWGNSCRITALQA